MEDLVGAWKLESRDKNFDAFLQCRQTRWFLRTIIGNVPADLAFELSDDKSVLTKKTISSMKTSEYPMNTTGEFVPDGTLSGKPEIGRILETSGRKVIQEMRFQEDNTVAAVIEHNVVDDKLHVKLKCKDIVCNEVYRRK